MKFILTLLLPFLLHADPWGKDADLATRSKIIVCSTNHCTPLLGSIAECLIGFHQNVISPADGPRSHFLPSSSQYTLNAIRKYGFFKGIAYGCDRLMRENNEPWVYPVVETRDKMLMKWDPVP